MSSFTNIAPNKLARLIGTPRCPVLVDVRIDADYALDPRLIPGAHRRPYDRVGEWAAQYSGNAVVVICQRGLKLSEGVAAWLRSDGIAAENLEGGFESWAQLNLPATPAAVVPARDAKARTVWVTRSRPKIDRLACPWLIRRFVDPHAVFLFVAPTEVAAVAEKFNATPFDVEDTFWSHRGALCTFDVMVQEFMLETPPLARLATIVRGADTARLDLAPESAGLLAVSLGLSRMYANDLDQLDAALGVYDALYRWSRDAVDETHDWPPHRAVPQ